MFDFLQSKKKREYHRSVDDWLLVFFCGFADNVLPAAKAKIAYKKLVQYGYKQKMEAAETAIYALRVMLGNIIDTMTETDRAICLTAMEQVNGEVPFYKGLNYMFQVLEQARIRPGVSSRLIDSVPYFITGKLRGMTQDQADGLWLQNALHEINP